MMLHELREVLRRLRREPLVPATVITILGLAIGLNASVFSVLDAVLLRSFDCSDPDRLVRIRAMWPRNPDADIPLPGGFVDRITRETEAFARVSAAAPAATAGRATLAGEGPPEALSVGRAHPSLFETLGVRPALGRLFAPDEPPGSAILSHEFWRGRFGGDPGVLGETLVLDRVPHRIAGVLPDGFDPPLPGFASRPPVWVSPDPSRETFWSSEAGNQGALYYVARLARDASLEAARLELERVAEGIRSRDPDYARLEIGLTVDPLRERLVAPVRPFLLVLFGAVAFVLVVACANVANLLLARAERRRRDLVVRKALGASTWRITRLALVEGAVLAGLGAIGGVLLAAGTTGALVRWAPPGVPRLDAVAVDLRVLGFALLLAVVAALLAALVPAVLTARKGDLTGVLRSGRTGDGGSTTRLQSAFAAGQVALALVLVVGAGLLAHTLVRLQRVDPGFETSGLLTFSLAPPEDRYDDGEEAGDFLTLVEERLAALPGVRAVGTGWPVPLGPDAWRSPYAADTDREDVSRTASYRIVTPRFFRALGLDILEGRAFEASDPGRGVVLVSRSVAEEKWPGGSPIGRRILANPWGGDHRALEVVGVVEDVRDASLREAPGPALYFPAHGWAWAGQSFTVLVRENGDPTGLVPSLRSALEEVAPGVPVADVARYDDLLARHVASGRFALSLVGLFAGTAGALALLGLYGVLAYRVSRRKRELGIRAALGADRRRILGLVLRDGARLIAAGCAVGTLAALMLSRLLESQLHGVAPRDPPTFLAAVLVLGGAALLVTWLPARRAARLEPMAVLREE